MKRLFIIAGFAIIIGFIWTGTGVSKKPTHLDGSKNTAGCGGCHAGAGAPGTPLLLKSRETLCFTCHGSIRGTKKRGAKTDIERVFAKESKHPIFETSQYHMDDEELPERNPSAQRHVSCADCHKAHHTVPERPWTGAKGYSAGKIRLRLAIEEYELCYNCHSDSSNLPPDYTDKSKEFSAFNASYHPVEVKGKNSFSPSLVRQLTTFSTITCSDCHGNNSIQGPDGPHGSDYAPILKAQYRTTDGPESAVAYELCYMCHDRRSILGDESFRRHKLHIVYNNTACFTCHGSHGVKENDNLIRFNTNTDERFNTNLRFGRTIVLNSPMAGGPQFIPVGRGTPKCLLLCHGVDHSMEFISRNVAACTNATAPGCKKWPW